MISCLPFTNSARFLHRESTVYASATFSASREFHASSANRTFRIAVSRVNGGSGGRAASALACALDAAPPALWSVISPSHVSLSILLSWPPLLSTAASAPHEARSQSPP